VSTMPQAASRRPNSANFLRIAELGVSRLS
jgi:hypothetical protein